jgi:hypothetical protein
VEEEEEERLALHLESVGFIWEVPKPNQLDYAYEIFLH